MSSPQRPQSPAARDAAATRRSYRLLYVGTFVAWGLVLSAIYAAAVVEHHHRERLDHTSFLVIAGVLTIVMCLWLAFLRGLERRDLSRINGAQRYDPRS